MSHVLFGQTLLLQPLRPRAGRPGHGPAPGLRHAQPGRPGARPRARRRALLARGRRCLPRLDARPRSWANRCCERRSATPGRPRAGARCCSTAQRCSPLLYRRGQSAPRRALGLDDRDPVGLAGVRGVEDRRARDEERGARAAAEWGRSSGRSRRRPPAPPWALPASSARSRAIFSGERAMNGCPPQPGLTVMQSARSIVPATRLSTATGVPGLIATPTHAPRLADQVGGVAGVRRGLGVEGDRVAPPRARTPPPGARDARSSGARRASPPPPATCSRSAETTSGPIVIGGTKWPSITSTWITRAPAASTSPTCSRSRPKSAERIEGATRTPPAARVSTALISSGCSSDRHQHAVAAVVALEDRRRGHPHDRRVLTAVGAHRGQLEAVQAVDAAVAAGKVRRAQPRLASSSGRAGRGRRRRLPHSVALGAPSRRRLSSRRSRAMKKPAVRSRWGSVSTQRLSTDAAGSSAPRFSRAKSGCESRKAAIWRSFSVGEMVHVE